MTFEHDDQYHILPLFCSHQFDKIINKIAHDSGSELQMTAMNLFEDLSMRFPLYDLKISQ
jgi:hypothetical protein